MQRMTMLIIMLCAYATLFAQDHLPIPHTIPHGTSRICWGYAMGRAGGKSDTDATCSPKTMIPDDNSISSEYFAQYPWSQINSKPLKSGDILYWPGTHAAYVTDVPKVGGVIDVDNIGVAHMSASQWTGVIYETLAEAKDRVNVGNPSDFCQYQPITITLQNSFGGGTLQIQTIQGTTQYNHGATPSVSWSLPISLIASDQDDGTLFRKWVSWQKDLEDAEDDNPWSIIAESGSTYKANFNSYADILFSNSFPGASGGTMTVWDTSRAAPSTVRIPATQSFNIAAASQTAINGIQYTFSQWSGASTSSNPSLTSQTASQHKTYTANYTAKPLPPTGISPTATVGNPVEISWTDNPHDSVSQYQIWRKVKPLGGAEGSAVHIGTVNKGVQEFTDNEYIVTSSYTDYLLTYDVRSKLELSSGTFYADPNWSTTVFGEPGAKMADNHQNTSATATELPTEFAISSYPNPFNPTTTISYQLAEDASVTLAVYDMVGREVATLVQGDKSAGYHSVQWNGKDASNRTVASGVYLYRFTAQPVNGAKPFVQSGKLILSK